MRDYVIMLAKYNQKANYDLNNVLKGIKSDDFSKDVKLFLKSIKGVYEHILTCDMWIFTTLKTYTENLNTKHIDVLKNYNTNFSLQDCVTKDLASLIVVREEMDKLIIDILNSINDYESNGEILIPSGPIVKKRIQLTLHILNHATHHRGEISAALDQMGYKNDFSNILTAL